MTEPHHDEDHDTERVRYVEPADYPPAPPRPPETPIERLRRLADPKTRNVPAEVILAAVVTVVDELTDEIAEQRRQIAEQRAWIDDAARGFLRRTVEDAVKHNRPKPIPTPNQPDQTPTAQAPSEFMREARESRGETCLDVECPVRPRPHSHND